MTLLLEDFETPAPQQPVGDPETLTRADAETEKVAAYELGYQAGWDDAVQTATQDQTRIGAEFARNLQELSFTFHEARAYCIQALEPLLSELIGKLLPQLVNESLGLKIIEELRPMIEDSADISIELVTAPQNLPALQTQLAKSQFRTVQLVAEPSLAEGQVYLRIGKSERLIDLNGAFESISTALNALYSLNERALKHA